MDDTEWIHKR